MTVMTDRRRRVRTVVSSIRVRIVTAYVLLMLVAVAVIVLITRQIQLARADREIAAEQVQEVEELRRFADEGVDPATGRPFGTDVTRMLEVFISRNVPSDDEGFYALVDGVETWYSIGRPPLLDVPEVEGAWAAITTPTLETWSNVAGIGEVRSLGVPLSLDGTTPAVFVVASFPADDQDEVDQLVRVLILAGLAVVALTSVVVWSIAGRVLQPGAELSATARQITEDDLSARLPVQGHDELADLGTTFNDMVDRLERGFAQQRRFLDDAAHELRTPITIARGHLEILGDDPVERGRGRCHRHRRARSDEPVRPPTC